MVLKGKKVILRGVEPEDLPDRHRWLNDREVTHFFTTLGSYHLSLEQLQKWLDECSRRHNELHFSIDTAAGKHIGGAQLKGIDWRNRHAELGIFIGEKEEWGKGYCSEAVALLLHYAFDTLNLHRIWLRVDAENTGAIRCYEKAGFSREGVFREEVYREGKYNDTLILSILEREYRQTDGLAP